MYIILSRGHYSGQIKTAEWWSEGTFKYCALLQLRGLNTSPCLLGTIQPHVGATVSEAHNAGPSGAHPPAPAASSSSSTAPRLSRVDGHGGGGE